MTSAPWARWVWLKPLLSWFPPEDVDISLVRPCRELGKQSERWMYLGCEVIPHLLASGNALELFEATVCPTVSGDLQVFTKNDCVAFIHSGAL